MNKLMMLKKRLNDANQNHEELILKLQTIDIETAKYKLESENLKDIIEGLKNQLSRDITTKEEDQLRSKSMSFEKRQLDEKITFLQLRLDKSKINEKKKI